MNSVQKVVAAILTSIAIIALGTNVNAQEKKIHKKDVPQAVLAAFEKNYPDAKVRGYSTEAEDGKTFFEIESMRGRMTLDVSYLPDGSAAEIEEGVTVGELPDAVKAAVKSNYPRGTIARAERRTVGTTVTFELRIRSGKAQVGMEIDPAGKILKKTTKNAESERND